MSAAAPSASLKLFPIHPAHIQALLLLVRHVHRHRRRGRFGLRISSGHKRGPSRGPPDRQRGLPVRVQRGHPGAGVATRGRRVPRQEEEGRRSRLRCHALPRGEKSQHSVVCRSFLISGRRRRRICEAGKDRANKDGRVYLGGPRVEAPFIFYYCKAYVGREITRGSLGVFESALAFLRNTVTDRHNFIARNA